MIRKVLPLSGLIFLLVSCKSYLYNKAFEKIGIYDKQIELSRLEKDNREIVFFPMIHIGTEEFYNDVKNKVDSLKKEGYYFYTEQVKSDRQDDILLLII